MMIAPRGCGSIEQWPRGVRGHRVQVRALGVALLLVAGEVRLEQVRWWRSPQAVARSGVSEEQADSIDAAYAEAMREEASFSVEVIRLTNQLCAAIDDSADNETLGHITEQIVEAQAAESRIGRRFADGVRR